MCEKADDELSKSQALQLKRKLTELFGRLSATQTLSSKAWELYASLKKPCEDNVDEGDKYVQLLEKSLLAISNKPNWGKDVESCCSVLSKAIKLATERLRFASLKGENAVKQTKSRVRMSLKPLLTVVKRDFDSQSDECTHENKARVMELIKKVDSILMEVSS
ncbi:hypothetical protein DICVIV_03340 [Dictyocaulus viviparus]|uniref:Uncharacterized protein n=1 Tax=Dictyocaulus viviparus TaxID=29172 RepID=A0A0D8Y1C7_DICVI|nr:hypothetical protein DICVIV_03340 [Dictyocaulus viviparus]